MLAGKFSPAILGRLKAITDARSLIQTNNSLTKTTTLLTCHFICTRNTGPQCVVS